MENVVKSFIKEEIGDLLESGCTIRCHQVNCYGVMGAGIAKQVQEKYPEAFSPYRELCDLFHHKMLGEVQFIACHDKTIIANLYSQAEFGTDILALEECLKKVYNFALKTECSVGFPKYIGAALGGGNWNEIRGLIYRYFNNPSVDCTIVEWYKNLK